MGLSIRFAIPDRPGALAAVTRTLAAEGADILSVHVLEREEGRALDEIRLRWPAGRDVLPLLGVLDACQGVSVEGYRRNAWPLDGRPDLDLLGHVLNVPDRGVETVVDMAPAVLDADWAVLCAPESGSRPLYASASAPSDPYAPDELPRRAFALRENQVEYAVVPLEPAGSVLVVGRDEGPRFSRTELAHAERVVGLALAALRRTTSVAASEPAAQLASA